jgi:hypothetical protein
MDHIDIGAESFTASNNALSITFACNVPYDGGYGKSE